MKAFSFILTVLGIFCIIAALTTAAWIQGIIGGTSLMMASAITPAEDKKAGQK